MAARALIAMARLWMLLCLGLLPPAAGAAEPRNAPPGSANPEAAADTEGTPERGIPLQRLRAFADILATIDKYYVAPIDQEQLLEAAIRGMLDELDPHSQWLDTRDFESVTESATGRYAGIGVVVGASDGELLIREIMGDTPAARGGLASGDRIIAIDGEFTDSERIPAAIERLRGPAGSTVVLSIRRGSAGQLLEVELRRELIRIRTVHADTVGGHYLHLRLQNFQQDTATQIETLIRERMNSEVPPRGIVLDLRGNPGGMLDAAVATTDLFIDGGVIVSTRGRGEGSNETISASPPVLTTLPMVVLIDSETASAAEIVAGALQHHRRALILGQRSFGKGSVQSVLPLRDGAALRLTTSRYYTPGGRSIQAHGIEPDVPLAADPPTRDDAPREADLRGHITNPEGAYRGPLDSGLRSSDYELYQAVNMLRGLSRMAKRPGPEQAARAAQPEAG